MKQKTKQTSIYIIQKEKGHTAQRNTVTGTAQQSKAKVESILKATSGRIESSVWLCLLRGAKRLPGEPEEPTGSNELEAGLSAHLSPPLGTPKGNDQ